MMLVDSHVNLHGEKFAEDLDTVVARAKTNGVDAMLNICCLLSDFPKALAVAEKYNNMWVSVGTHPHDAKENPNIKPSDIVELCDSPKVIGIGETGLDYHYNYSEPDVQRKNFIAHIEAAREIQLPLIIHTREADDEMGDILERELGKGEFPTLLHCYSSGPRLAERAAELGCYFALSGIITFKNAHEVRAIAAKLPDDRIMLETDCPYLTPVPHRGQRNEPAYVPYVAEKLSEIKGWSLEETSRKTTDAFFRLFSKAERPS